MTTGNWIVWHPNGGDEGPDDGKRFHATSAENAAEQWAERFGSDCEYISETVIVCLIVIVCLAERIADAGYQRRFRVQAQSSRDYFVDELP